MRFLDALQKNPVLLAPMAGVADAPFRALCKRFGAGATYTEMISAKGLHYDKQRNRSHRLLRPAPEEVPVVVQLFGSDPQLMAQQTRVVAELMGESVQAIDLNMGCPVAKVVGKGEGAALMREPKLAARIISAMVDVLDVCGRGDIAVTAKIRSGLTADTTNALELARALEAAGAAALAVHGRSADQYYRGHSDPSVVTSIKENLAIPVIASGDIFTAQDVVSTLRDLGVDGVMVARGARGNPWIFREAQALLSGKEPPLPPGIEERLALLREHAAMSVAWYEDPHLARMRKHAVWYLTGQPAAAVFRRRLHELSTLDELDTLIAEYLDEYRTRHDN